jgi:hypothetical protein
MADTLGSVGVIVSTLLIKWFGWTGFDPIASIFIAILIILSVIPLIKQASAVMMLELDDETVAVIEGTLDQVRTLEGVYSISHTRFWPYEAESVIGSLHVQVKDDVNTQSIRQTVTDLLKSHIHGLREVCVQIELQSAVKKNRFTVPQRGFFHTPAYHGVSSMNNAYVNYRSNAPVVDTQLKSDSNITNPPSVSASSTIAVNPSSNVPSTNINVMSVLQKQTKKE